MLNRLTRPPRHTPRIKYTCMLIHTLEKNTHLNRVSSSLSLRCRLYRSDEIKKREMWWMTNGERSRRKRKRALWERKTKLGRRSHPVLFIGKEHRTFSLIFPELPLLRVCKFFFAGVFLCNLVERNLIV